MFFKTYFPPNGEKGTKGGSSGSGLHVALIRFHKLTGRYFLSVSELSSDPHRTSFTNAKRWDGGIIEGVVVVGGAGGVIGPFDNDIF